MEPAALILEHRMRRHRLTTHGVAVLTMMMLNDDAEPGVRIPQWTHRYVESALNGGAPGIHTMIDAIDTHEGVNEPTDVCNSLPGTEERIAAYEARFSRGESIFNPCDFSGDDE